MIYTSREVYEYISRQTNDPIIEWKTCAISGTQFPIYQSDLDFYTKISRGLPGYQESPLSGGEGLGVRIPTPTLCPEERQRRRLSFRNERKLYKRTCDATGDRIISIYSPDKPYKVYDQKFRRSDHRDPMDYGRDFDFSKTFTEQFRELMREVPLLGLMNMENEYSEYTNYTGRSKNCYLCNDVMYSDMLMYSNIIKNCSNSLELSDNKESIECYQLLRSENCRKCYFGVFLENCNNCYFSYNLNNCKNCIYSANLNNKEYYIYNKSVSKDDFIEMLNTIQTD
ncbi:MAG TPA: hypothetical protein PLW93_01135, partial [Candidatus Absconditabacterales bacterium]|nr:hypothetical protein [Candidatus Absconditabacterales bacterium]